MTVTNKNGSEQVRNPRSFLMQRTRTRGEWPDSHIRLYVSKHACECENRRTKREYVVFGCDIRFADSLVAR
jgi:hypothetical protein